MSVILTLHDFEIDPNPAIPGTGASSVIAEATLKNLDRSTTFSESTGFAHLAAAGITPRGFRRRTPTKLIPFTVGQMETSDLENLLTFWEACGGPERPFWLTLPSEWLPPVSAFPGAVLTDGTVIVPGSTLFIGDRISLADSQTFTFTQCYWLGAIEYTALNDRSVSTFGPLYQVGGQIRIEIPDA